MKDPILQDIIDAHREGFHNLEPSKVGTLTVNEILEATQYMTETERRAWLKENSNMRGPRILGAR